MLLAEPLASAVHAGAIDNLYVVQFQRSEFQKRAWPLQIPFEHPHLAIALANMVETATTSSTAVNGHSDSASASVSNSEISSLVLPHLDRHLALPVLQFLEENGIYPKEELVAAKYALLKPTNMVHYVEQLKREVDGQPPSDESSQETKDKADQILKRGNELKEKADRVIEVISNPQVAAALGQDKERNLTTLREKYNVSRQTAGAHPYEYPKLILSLASCPRSA